MISDDREREGDMISTSDALASPLGWRSVCAGMALLAATFAAHAQGAAFQVPTREGVSTTVFWESAPGAASAVLLFPGGGYGRVQDGQATSSNFLVRSARHFTANGFDVAIFGRPDGKALDPAERTGPAHMADAAEVLEFVKRKSDRPVWLIGTS
jgi:hypothetical protein